MEKLFSIEEANVLLPRLEEMLGQVQTEKKRLVSMKSDVEGAKEGHICDWGTPIGPAYVMVLEAFQESVLRIKNLGVLVKDFDIGLCDFPHQRDGKVVYLCWKLGEKKIGWWHDINNGFSERQPL